MFCGQCGRRIQADESLCVSCGADLTGQQKPLQKISIRTEELSGQKVPAAEQGISKSILSATEPRAHSKLGVASFVISICVGVLSLLVGTLLLLINISIFDDSNAPWEIRLGGGLILIYCVCCQYLFMALDLLAFCIGIGGVFQNDRKKMYAKWGIAISVVNILGTVIVLFSTIAMMDNYE